MADATYVNGIREPTQKRAREALDRLITAGSELCAERGASGFTLLEVGERAGVSNGSMYFRIQSREALLYAIHERWDREVDKELEHFRDPAQWADLDLVEAVDKAVRVVAAVYDLNPRLLRALGLHAGSDPEMAARATASVQRGASAFAQAIAPRMAVASIPEPDVTAALLHTTVCGALGSRLTWPEFHVGPQPDWDTFVDYVCSMATASVRESAIG